MIIREIVCKNVLIKSKISDYDFSLNPYTGCEHNCQYCYAVFMRKFTGHKEKWGEFVDVKINAIEILIRQTRKIKEAKINVGTACDPYQPVEKKYEITRRCLDVLSETENFVSILTKSDLILRDLDILKRIKNIEIGFSIPIVDPNIQKIFETKASSSLNRFNAIKILNDNAIKTWIFVAPILPGFTDEISNLKNIFTFSKSSGIRDILFDSLNPYPSVFSNLIKIYKKIFPDKLKLLHNFYYKREEYLHKLREKISQIAEDYKIDAEFCF